MPLHLTLTRIARRSPQPCPSTQRMFPVDPRLSYRDVATNAVPTEQAGSTPNAPLSPEGKGPAPCVEDTASAELAVTSGTGVSFSQPSDRAIRADHIQIVRSLLAGLSFEDKCGIVAPLASGFVHSHCSWRGWRHRANYWHGSPYGPGCGGKSSR